MDSALNPSPEVHTYRLKDDGIIPNNPKLPLVVYRGALRPEVKDMAGVFEEIFNKNGWGGSWRNGVYPFPHYHSTAHEVLGCYRGSAKIRFGGECGVILEVRAGDVAILPAGTGHQNLGASFRFGVVGAYPAGQEHYDMCYGKAGERLRADDNINRVPLPGMDPLYGPASPLGQNWKHAYGQSD